MYCPAFQSPQWRRLASCAHAALANESGHFMGAEVGAGLKNSRRNG